MYQVPESSERQGGGEIKKINLILPAAGLGSRFREMGEKNPKPLINVFDIPMILWVLSNFPLHYSDKVWIIVQRKDNLPNALADFLVFFPFEVEFLEIDGLTEGPASTVALVLDRLPDSEGLIVANTDQFVFEDLTGFVEEVRSGESLGQILTMIAHSNSWSYVGRGEDGQINLVVEKSQISDEATVGVYGWSLVKYAKESFRDTFMNNIRTNNEFYVAPTYNFMIKQNQRVKSILIGDHEVAVHGLGIPSDLSNFLKNPKALNVANVLKMRFQIS
jgi:NDP-sugar pyrophosphorylase family protein